MYTLTQSLFKRWKAKEEYNILLIGLDQAGKSTIIEKIKSQNGLSSIAFTNIAPTVGQNVCRLNRKKTRLLFWDLGGRESLRSIWADYLEEAHATVFVIDAANTDRFNECYSVLSEISENPNFNTNKPLVILLNKCDLDNAIGLEKFTNHKIYLLAATMTAKPSDLYLASTSAQSGEGLKEAVDWIENQVIQNGQDFKPKLR